MSKPIENCPQPETPIRDRAYTERQLLELAAKAVGIKRSINEEQNTGYYIRSEYVITGWNPFCDDGDALRLAVKLRLLVDVAERNNETVVIWAGGPVGGVREPHETDPYAATRRAIVRAAAAIAEGAKS